MGILVNTPGRRASFSGPQGLGNSLEAQFIAAAYSGAMTYSTMCSIRPHTLPPVVHVRLYSKLSYEHVCKRTPMVDSNHSDLFCSVSVESLRNDN